MKFTIGQTVTRQDPGGHQTSFSIQSGQDVQYHTYLIAKGYTYQDITKSDALEFDLPVVAASAPRQNIHTASEAVCVACEG